MSAEKIKKTVKKILFLPPVPTLAISVPSYALVIYALAAEQVHPAVVYLSYLLSSYGFIITITGIYGVIRWVRQGIHEHPLTKKILSVPLFRRYLKEAPFRTVVSLYFGFAINMLYVFIKLFSGIRYGSIWFGALAVYYVLFAVMRLVLLLQVWRKGGTGNEKGPEWRKYRLCGIILLLMNEALVGIIVLVLHLNSSFEYPGMLIYVMAMYAFYAVITAVMNVIKFRKYGSPVLSAAKAVNLTAALVSILSLETAMLTQFGAADDEAFRRTMTASTGGGVSIIVLGMAVYMVVHGTRMINLYRSGGGQ